MDCALVCDMLFVGSLCQQDFLISPSVFLLDATAAGAETRLCCCGCCCFSRRVHRRATNSHRNNETTQHTECVNRTFVATENQLINQLLEITKHSSGHQQQCPDGASDSEDTTIIRLVGGTVAKNSIKIK